MQPLEAGVIIVQQEQKQKQPQPLIAKLHNSEWVTFACQKYLFMFNNKKQANATF